MNVAMRCPARVVGLAVLLAFALAGDAGAFQDFRVFSSGMTTPETITPVPGGGSYLVPDPVTPTSANHYVWSVPSAGGAPTLFATTPQFDVGGLFLPGSYGSGTSLYATVGYDLSTQGAPVANIYTYSATGTPSLFYSDAAPNGGFSTAQIAPTGFGAYAGELLVTQQYPADRLVAISPAGVVTTVATGLPINTFGTAFAPGGFGSLAGQLLVDGGSSNQIDSVAADGTVTPFATVALLAGQIGLRQMAFSPSGFLPGYGSLLFVSVSGSNFGGGTLGDVEAFDGGGNLVAQLRSNLGLTKFDPRGLTFTGDGSLLISDTSDPIYIAGPGAFVPVPEPSALALQGLGLVLAAVAFRRGAMGRLADAR